MSIGRVKGFTTFFFLCVHLTNFADGGILTVPPLIVQLVLLGGGEKREKGDDMVLIDYKDTRPIYEQIVGAVLRP